MQIYKTILSLLGYFFVAGVSIWSALQVNSPLAKILLVVSAFVSLVLAVTRLFTTLKMANKIRSLEENQWYIEPDSCTQTFIFETEKYRREKSKKS